jgi:hypothetical protein
MMSALAPAPAAAVSVLADLTVDATTVDPQTGIGHLTISVTCLVPGWSITAHVGIQQIEGQGRRAISGTRGGVLTGCGAGQRISIVITFQTMGGDARFGPGPATISGQVALFGIGPDAASLSFGPMTALLHPER